MDDVGSKHIDGVTDLVVVAPVKPGFIKAFETISYASRLDVTANALNMLRVAAREYERVVPFSDVTERILGLFDFRIGVIDRDLFAVTGGTAGATMRASRWPRPSRPIPMTSISGAMMTGCAVPTPPISAAPTRAGSTRAPTRPPR
jgi:hypothetical protein